MTHPNKKLKGNSDKKSSLKPGLKNVALIAVAAVIIGGAFFLAEYRNGQAQNVVYIAPATATTTDPIALTGRDADWQKILLNNTSGTSGTSAIVTSKIPQVALTPIDKLSRDFFAQYMQLHEEGLDTDPASQQALVSNVLANGVVMDTPKVYSGKDIITETDTSPAAIKEYGNEVSAVFLEYQITGEDEPAIVKDSIDKDDPSLLAQIDPKITIYKNIIAGILKVETPQNLSQMQLDLLNAMSTFVLVDQEFRQSDVDPLKGMQGASNYATAATALINAMQNLRDFMTKSNISYSVSDPGSFVFGSSITS